MAPTRPLLVLTLAVLAAHAMVLRPAAGPVQAPPRPATAFVMRTVAAPAPTPVAATTHPAAPRLAATRPETRIAAVTAIKAAPRRLAATVAPTALAPDPPASQHKPESAPSPAPEAQPTSAPAGPVVVPGSVRLLYRVDVRRGGLSLEAQSELRWRQDGTNYEAQLEVRSPLMRPRTQRSTGRITPEGLAPLRFSDKGRSEEAAHFDRDQGKLTFSTNRPDTPLLPGAQDRLSVLVQLGAIVAGAPAKFPPGAAITLQTAGTRDAEPWVFVIEGEEQLELPGGKLGALKLTRNPRKEYDIKVELWLAPGMDYVPVRLRLTQPNGDSVDQQWSSTDRG